MILTLNYQQVNNEAEFDVRVNYSHSFFVLFLKIFFELAEQGFITSTLGFEFMKYLLSTIS